jgi:hypothetical protein
MPSPRIGLAIVAAALTACATHAPASPDGSRATVSASATRNRDIITREELSVPSVSSLTVLDAVKSLRPQFLTVRGLNTVPAKDNNGTQLVDQESGKVHVSIDGNKLVPVEELSGIRAGAVVEIRFLNPQAAMQKFGGTARQGPVILVRTM